MENKKITLTKTQVHEIYEEAENTIIQIIKNNYDRLFQNEIRVELYLNQDGELLVSGYWQNEFMNPNRRSELIELTTIYVGKYEQWTEITGYCNDDEITVEELENEYINDKLSDIDMIATIDFSLTNLVKENLVILED